MTVEILCMHGDSDSDTPSYLINFRIDEQIYTTRLTDDCQRFDNDEPTFAGLDDEVQAQLNEELTQFLAANNWLPEQVLETLNTLAKTLGELTNKAFEVVEAYGGDGYELREVRDDASIFRGRYHNSTQAYRDLEQQIADAPPLPTKRFNANIPEWLHDEFKIACTRRKVDMTVQVIALIKAWL